MKKEDAVTMKGTEMNSRGSLYKITVVQLDSTPNRESNCSTSTNARTLLSFCFLSLNDMNHITDAYLILHASPSIV